MKSRIGTPGTSIKAVLNLIILTILVFNTVDVQGIPMVIIYKFKQNNTGTHTHTLTRIIVVWVLCVII